MYSRIVSLLVLTLITLTTQAGSATITVNYHNANVDSLSLTFTRYWHTKSEELYASSANGTFKWQLSGFENYAYFKIDASGSNSRLTDLLFVKEGDSLVLTVDDPKHIIFSGRGWEKCAFLWEEVQKRPFKLGNRQEESLDLFFDYMDAREKSSIRHLEAWKEKLEAKEYLILKAEVIGYIEAKKMQNLQISYGGRKDLSLDQLKTIYKQRVSIDPFGLAPDEITTVSDNYLYYVLNRQIVEQLINGNSYGIKALYLTHKKKYSKTVNENILYYFIANNMEMEGLTPEIEFCIQDYLSYAPSESYKLLMQEKYDALKAYAAKGKPAFDFTLTNTEGVKVSLADFRNKVVVLDFWYTGCTGCKLIAPYMARIEGEFHKQKTSIAFVSISIDKSKEMWLKSVQNEIYTSKGSINLYTEGNAENHPMIKGYDISSYPRLVVIDKNGKIVDANAPLPQNETGEKKLMEKISEALAL